MGREAFILVRIRFLAVMLAGLFISVSLYSQADKKYIRKGNRQYGKSNYSEAEIDYRKAGEKNAQSPDATFNVGDALYKQKKYEDAGKKFLDNTTQTTDAEKKSAGWYNLGNSFLQADKIKESIDAYKNALKLDPENNEAKYNLGYAQNLLKKQEQQQQQQQQQQNQKDQDKDQKNQQDKNDNKQNNDQNQQQKQQQNQQNQQQQGISKEDAERLLNALANDEKNVQEKVKREKAAKARTRTLKNW